MALSSPLIRISFLARLRYRTLSGFLALLFASCEEKPCINPPYARMGLMHTSEWKSTIPTDSLFIGLNSGRVPLNTWPYSIRTQLEGKSLHFRIPENQTSFWLIFAGKNRKDSTLVRFNSRLRYADGACGFYTGFEKPTFETNAGSYFNQPRVLFEQGDSSNTIHAIFNP